MSILTKFTNTIGETITFYSYKGGNGRTMALSNVATLLAQQNPQDKILVIDWDLEAPGLHRFFFQDSLFSKFTNDERDKLYMKVEEKVGLIDLFISLRNMIDEYSTLNEKKLIVDSSVTKILDNLKLDDFILSTSFNNLHILKAGCFDKHYPDKVNTFNWEELYNKAPSLIRLFSSKLTKNYKYVLIDSRTGFTDISGICTMLMPQKLVVVFTPNRQSYTGIKELIIKATTYRRKSNDFRPLLVFPLPSRIEFSRDDLRAYWRYGNPEKRITGYQNIFQDIFKDVYGLDECNLTEYFEQVQIQQSPNYAYGEEIAIVSEKTKDSFSLSKSYEIFTQWLVDSNAPWESKQSEESSNVNTSAAIDFESIGLEFQNKGQYEKALSYYNRSLAIYGEFNDKKGLAQIHNKIGSLLKNMGEYDDALDNHQKALDIHLNIKDQLNIAKDYTNIASIFEKRSQYDQALELYEEALKINPNNFEVYYNKGKILHKLKQFEEAIKCYDQVVRIDPDHVNAWNSKGLALYDLGKYQEAIEYYDKALAVDPGYKEALNNKGLALYDLGKYQEAIEYYDKAIVYYREAIKYYDKALAVDPGYKEALNNKGLALYDLGKYQEAIEYYDKALAVDPSYKEALNNKGLALYDLGKYQEAIEYYDKALAVDSDYVEALNNKGLVLSKQEYDREAMEYYDKALAVDPDYVNAWNNKGWSFRKQGKYQEAIEYYDKALAVDPSYTLAITNKRLALELLYRDKTLK